MALTPGSYVPQGQVGTGAAYVHEIKDRSGYVEALAEAAKQERVEQEKQMAKLKGFDYGKVVDPVMKQHISEQYKKGLTAFSEVVSKGGDISSITTPEGIAFSDWQNNIKNEADTAARAEAMKSQFQTTVANNVDDYDVDIVNAALSSYDNAQTPDQKLKAMVNFNPLYVRGFDYNKWINTQFDNAVKDVEVTDFGGDINKYQEVYNQKIDVLPDVLAVDPGYPIAELQWQRKKDKKEPGFQQDNFGQFLTEQIDYQRRLRESKRESPAAKPDVNQIFMPGATPVSGTVTPSEVSQTAAINFDLGKAASNNSGTGEQLFWTANPQKPTVPYLVLKGKGSNPAEYGLGDEQGAVPNEDGDGILVPSDQLWKLASPHVSAIDLQIGDDTDEARKFKSKSFKDETGKDFTGQPKQIYEDQLGNTWMNMNDAKSSGVGHILLKAGGISQTYKDSYGELKTNPLVNIANSNMRALEAALGINYDEFIRKYQRVNFRQ
jgi:hypothetical protein